MPMLSAPQNHCLNLIFVKDIEPIYSNWFKNYNIKRKFMIFSPVANLMHHPLDTMDSSFFSQQMVPRRSNFPHLYSFTKEPKDPTIIQP